MADTTRRGFMRAGAAGLVAGGLWPSRAAAAPTAADLDLVIEKAYATLKERQGTDGGYLSLMGPGVTALVAAALLKAGKAPDDPVVAKALAVLEKAVRPDGGIYTLRLANYTTCVALLALNEANAGGKYTGVIKNATNFLKGLQKGAANESLTDSDPTYGGTGYDGRTRPDLSNTHFFVDALLASGVSKDDPAVKSSLVFIGRCQNLPGESNKLAYAEKTTPEDKGGFVYNPQDADNEKSQRRTPVGGLKSAGSMTYAGLKSMLYAGVSKDDERVKAAVAWAKKHYTLDENPGQGTAGLYYYYHLFAKAMDAMGEAEFADADGKKHDWRQELFDKLKATQRPDGSWANKNGAFMENAPELATAFAVLALSYCKPAKK